MWIIFKLRISLAARQNAKIVDTIKMPNHQHLSKHAFGVITGVAVAAYFSLHSLDFFEREKKNCTKQKGEEKKIMLSCTSNSLCAVQCAIYQRVRFFFSTFSCLLLEMCSFEFAPLAATLPIYVRFAHTHTHSRQQQCV